MKKLFTLLLGLGRCQRAAGTKWEDHQRFDSAYAAFCSGVPVM